MRKLALPILFITLLLLSAAESKAASEDFFGFMPVPHSNLSTDIEINSLDHIFEATWGTGINRSINYGTSYSQMINGLNNLFVSDIFIDSVDNLYAATAGGVFFSDDNGENWTELNNGLTNLFVQAVFVDSEGILYCGTRGNGIFRSTDSGQNWVESNDGLFYRDINSFIESRAGHIVAGSYGGGIFKSTDRGLSWVEANSGVRKKFIHDFGKDLAGDLYAASNGQGILLSVDNGSTWSPVDTSMDNMAVTDIVLNEHGDIVFGTRTGEIWFFDSRISGEWEQAAPFFKDGITSLAVNSNGTLYASRVQYSITRSVNDGRNWSGFISKGYATNVFLGFDNGKMFTTAFDDKLYTSDDYGDSWTQTTYSYDRPMILEMDSSRNIYAATAFNIYKSEDMGMNWTDITFVDSAGLISWAVKPNGDIFAIVRDTIGSRVFMSVDNGENWNNVRQMDNVFDAKIVVGRNNMIYMAYIYSPENSIEYKVDKSSNATDWTTIKTGNDPFTSLAFDIYGAFYAGSYSDIYRTDDAGTSWTSIGFKAGEEDDALIKDMIITQNNLMILNTESLELIYSADAPNMPDSLATSHYRSRAYSLKENLEADVFFWTKALQCYVNPESITPPELKGVPNNAGAIGHEPAFSWEPSDKAHLYHFQISADADFNYVIEEVFLSDTNYQIVTHLDFYTNYYWRVRGKRYGSFGQWSEKWMFTTLLEPPMLESPIDSTKGIPALATLSWHRVLGAKRYELEVATDPDFDDVVYFDYDVNDSLKTTDKLDYLTWHYWRVRAKNDDGHSDWSETWQFETVVAQPLLRYPLDGSRELYPDITFKWDTTAEATTYTLQLATDASFENPIYESETETDTSHRLTLIDYNTLYYWRVKAANQYGTGDWSEPWDFTTGLEEITLLTPENDTYCFGSDTLLTWQASPDADEYWLEISRDENFDNIIFSDQNLTETEYQTGELDKWTPYWWRVRARESERNGFIGQEWKFRTGLPEITLLSPENGSDNNRINPQLKWQSLYGAEDYHVQVASDEDFVDIVFEEEKAIVEKADVDGLEYNTKYYWRVRGYNEQVYSLWSTTWTFITEEEASIVLHGGLQKPFSGNVSPNPAREEIEINYNMPVEGNVGLVLFDLRGEELAQIYNGWAQMGQNKITWQVSQIPPGSYYIKITSDNLSEVISIRVVR